MSEEERKFLQEWGESIASRWCAQPQSEEERLDYERDMELLFTIDEALH